MADYEVKLVIKDDLPIREKNFIKNVIKELCDKLEMMVQEDGITYSKNHHLKSWKIFPQGSHFTINYGNIEITFRYMNIIVI